MVLMDLIDEYINFYIFKLYILTNTLLHLFQTKCTDRGIYKPYQVSVPFVTLILVIIMYFWDLNHLVVFFCWR